MTSAPSIAPAERPPELDKAQFEAIKDDVLCGDQSWRATINKRWAAFWSDKAKSTEEAIACNERLASDPRCDAVIAEKFRALNGELRSIRDKRLAMARDCLSGAPINIFEAELLLRLLPGPGVLT